MPEPITITSCAHCKHVYRNPDHDEECDCEYMDTLADDFVEAWEVVEVQVVRVLRREEGDRG